MTTPDQSLSDFLVDQGLAECGETVRCKPLSGGVSSDIWRVQTRTGEFCVKRALAKLKVAAHWEAPVERNAFEWAYMEQVSRIAPGSVPQPVAHDPQRGLFAMAWLDPAQYPLWKSELLAGHVDLSFAARLGDLVGRIHSATAADSSTARRFATDKNFHALRIEPYLLAAAQVHPDISAQLHTLAATTASTRQALVHGDVSPKNILMGPGGPVLLDAEVAWFGDPAFDMAFCLHHLAIKARVVAGARAQLALACGALANAYLLRVDWEPRVNLAVRVARLIPALALARVDGKSPVEYLSETQRSDLRAVARKVILAELETPSDALDAIIQG